MIFILKAFISIWNNKIIANFTYEVALRITEVNFNNFYNLDLNEYKRHNSVVFFREIRNSPAIFANSVLLSCFQLISEIFVVLLIIATLVMVNIQILSLFFIIILPVVLLFNNYYRKRMQAIGTDIWNLDIDTATLMNKSISGFVDIRLLDKCAAFINRFLGISNTLFQKQIQKTIYEILLGKMIEIVAVLGLLIIFIIHAFFLPDNSMSILTLFTVFGIAAYRLLPSISRIFNSILTLNRNKDLLHNLSEFNTFGSQAVSMADQVKLDFNRSIELKNVSYKYENKSNYVINNISLTIKKREIIGLVGKSGSGKTTFINLLLRFLQEEKGSIEIDGVKLDNTNIAAWRSRIGYVPENLYILDSSFKDNITLGETEIDEKRFERAVRLAQLSELVSNWKEGIETLLGENGAFISNGQKQRIGIARALYRNIDFLILDEATSALDINTEKEISETIKNLENEDITMLIIAHRYSILKNCNRIYELDNGSIAKQYTYDELIKLTTLDTDRQR
jgi:ABC-type multidrug transport system fused ATPase/permease subunit